MHYCHNKIQQIEILDCFVCPWRGIIPGNKRFPKIPKKGGLDFSAFGYAIRYTDICGNCT